MGKIISLVQLKGGVGRSTIATNLAGTLAETSRVALIDCDAPQFTSSHWLDQRRSRYEIDEELDLYQPSTYRSMGTLLTNLQQDYDYVVIDGPPRIDGFSRLALISSDLTLFPLGPSAAEVWSIEEMLKTVHEVSASKADFDGRVLWNRFRGYTRSANEQAKDARRILKLPEMRQKLTLRVSYADAMSEGLTVHEMDDKAARLEMWSLSSTVQRLLNSKKTKSGLSKEDWLQFAKANT